MSQSVEPEPTDQLPVSAQPEQDILTDKAPTKKGTKGKHTDINMETDGAVRKTRSAKARSGA
jgi:hypothetical protein